MSSFVLLSASLAETEQEVVADILGGLRGKTIAYVPSEIVPGWREYFDVFRSTVRRMGLRDADILPLTERSIPISRVLRYPAMFLSGGNTFTFLDALRRKGTFAVLQKYAASGRLMIGHSAGAILLTPTIRIAGLPPDYDRNEARLRNLVALRHVPFEFYPHFIPARHHKVLMKYSIANSRRAVLAAEDGGGVWCHGALRAFGNTHLYLNGSAVTLASASL
ncbi:MAG: hypothetical protein EBZ48_09320 [Proteobacteria bacterium]|nr:hypothetical protein [Pseudomonadota bacterium]